MDGAILGIFSTSFLIFSLVIALLVSGIRSVTEAVFKRLQVIIPDNIEVILIDLWREWVLRILPIFLGVLIGYFIEQYPYPSEFGNSGAGRVFFGGIAGLFSSTVYSMVKHYLKRYLPDNIKSRLQILDNFQDKEEKTE